MGQSFYNIYIHLVWRTKKREPFIHTDVEGLIFQVVKDKCHKYGFELIAVGNSTDHIHILTAINPREKLSDFIQEVKGASAYRVNHYTSHELYWQDGYGCISIGKPALGNIKRYVMNQKEHHQTKAGLIPEMEMTDED